MTWCQFGAVFIVCPEKIHLRYILGEIKHTRDARQALEINRQLISQELHIFQYILIRELSRAEVLGEGEKLGNKHGGKVSWRWFGDKVLNDDFWLMPIFQECNGATNSESGYYHTDNFLFHGSLRNVDQEGYNIIFPVDISKTEIKQEGRKSTRRTY